ncbi:unnamed protein product [Lactuca saligna]|uniref:TPX2 C-terminal domain-containing protein n=1 Tax=Lactuca saligna TaxID=75948 RepID=A0AA35YQQ9_LACSI|nr:unnamed protein product [Lactuca saligna]
MGEAAPCLMRSVSQPLFASCEYKEGDPLRALTTSISFGRFMTEPLDWEKWSSFSHNRTLEDVQKHSRPGAVAEKKAFFEAHYKKIASKKATKTKSPQKENRPPNHSPQTNITPPRSDTLSPIDEPQESESSKSITLTTTTPPAFSQHIHEQAIEIASCKDVCSPITNLVLEQFGNVEDDMASSRCQVEVEQGKVSSENNSLEKHKNKRNKGPEISLSKKETSRKTPTPPIRPKKAANDVTEKKRSVLQSLHMSMNFPPTGIKNRILKTISKPKDRLIQQPLNLKVSINGVKKASQVLPPPENKSVCTKKPKSSSSSSTVPSSFSFRSEERAAKRKEFFQKLEEKGNKKETEKIHLQPKLKTTNDNKKLRRSTALEAKTFASETKVIRSSNIQKVPQMQPCSPKLGRKPIPRLVHKDTRCESPSSKPKNFIEINKKKLSSSMAFLTSKKKNDSSSVVMSKKQC